MIREAKSVQNNRRMNVKNNNNIAFEPSPPRLVWSRHFIYSQRCFPIKHKIMPLLFCVYLLRILYLCYARANAKFPRPCFAFYFITLSMAVLPLYIYCIFLFSQFEWNDLNGRDGNFDHNLLNVT